LPSRVSATPHAPWHLVLPHAHGDHTNGACPFERAGARVLATAAAAAEIRQHGIQTYPGLLESADWGDLEAAREFDVVDTARVVDLGGLSVEIEPVPTAAHTPGDLIVTVPATGVLFTGDLVWNMVTPLAVHGSIRGWLDALDWRALKNPQRIVPGHGGVGGTELVDATRRYLGWIIVLAHRLADDGSDPISTAATRRAWDCEWTPWACAERDVVNLRVAIAEVTDTPFDMGSALLEMRYAAGGPIPAVS
jgi:cyclase